MIIKVRGTGNNSMWRFYEADEVQTHSYLAFEYEKETQFPKPVDMIVEDFVIPHNATQEGETITLISFMDGQCRPREIWSNTEAYLLNNNGKTIERLI